MKEKNISDKNFDAVIKPSKGFVSVDLLEIWRYRELLLTLSARDIKIRYQQTFLGAGWAVLQPFITMVVFTVFFGKLAKIPSEGVPYPIFSFVALLPWNYFSRVFSTASESLVVQRDLVSKVYFPRLIIPLSQVIGGLVDFAISFIILIGMMLFYGISPGISILFLPFYIIMLILSTLSISVWLAPLNVKYRDIRIIIPFLSQILLFLSPVVYPSSIVPSGKWRYIYGLNPMSGVIDGFRSSLLGIGEPFSWLHGVSFIVVILLLISGLVYFKKNEKIFADMI